MKLSQNGTDSLNVLVNGKTNKDTCYNLKQRQALNYIIESWRFLKKDNQDLRESKTALSKEYTEVIIQRDGFEAQVQLLKKNESNCNSIIMLKDKEFATEKKLSKLYKTSCIVLDSTTISFGLITLLLV